MREIAVPLHGQVVRADISWLRAEPRRGVYNETYLSQFANTVGIAAGHGMSVVVTVYETPVWASARTLWSHPPKGYDAGRYYSFYPPGLANIDLLRTFARHLSGKLAGRVLGYECWCEPNSWAYLFPQRTASDGAFGPHRYLQMLSAFSEGVRAGDPAAQVIAGATAPTGRNDRYGTSPQRFATVLKNRGAGDYFDVYSHHPYTPGGASNPAPEALPPYPSLTVSLGNIDTLLRIFPDKPFYLTEYGYNTRYTLAYGLYVDQAHQASYLQRAYRWAARFPQIKLLVWYLSRDWSPSHRATDPRGIYTGLRALDGAKKRSWYAFAGGNTLTLVAPAAVTRGSSLMLRGRLTCASVGGLQGKALAVQRYTTATGWRTVKLVESGTGGYYGCRLRPGGTATYRVSWRGVVSSPTARVAVW